DRYQNPVPSRGRCGRSPHGCCDRAARRLDRLELLERLAARLAVAERAARRRAKQVLEPRFRRPAVRTTEDAGLQLDERRSRRLEGRRRGEGGCAPLT